MKFTLKREGTTHAGDPMWGVGIDGTDVTCPVAFRAGIDEEQAEVMMRAALSAASVLTHELEKSVV